jgi:hypothetical protein
MLVVKRGKVITISASFKSGVSGKDYNFAQFYNSSIQLVYDAFEPINAYYNCGFANGNRVLIGSRWGEGTNQSYTTLRACPMPSGDAGFTGSYRSKI